MERLSTMGRPPTPPAPAIVAKVSPAPVAAITPPAPTPASAKTAPVASAPALPRRAISAREQQLYDALAERAKYEEGRLDSRRKVAFDDQIPRLDAAIAEDRASEKSAKPLPALTGRALDLDNTFAARITATIRTRDR